MINSLRYRLILWFLLSAFSLFALVFLLFWLHRSNKSEHQKILDNLEYIRYQIIKDQNQVAGFLSTEINDNNFFITGESPYLNEHYKLIENIDSCFVRSFSSNRKLYPQLKNSLNELKADYADYCNLFDSLVYAIYKRGYQNLGLEGEMTSYLYLLENTENFPIRSLYDLKLTESNYLHSFNYNLYDNLVAQAGKLKSNIRENTSFTNEQKATYNSLLKSYLQTFERLVEMDRKIGLSQSNGLKQQLSLAGNNLESSVSLSIENARRGFDSYMSRLNIFFALTAFLLLALTFGISLYTSRYLVLHLEQLTTYISASTKNHFDQKIDVDLRHSTSEIRQIYKAFRNMFAELRVREKQRDIAVRSAMENQNRYRELADLLPQSIFETDRSGKLTYVNQEWFNTFGYSSSDIRNGVNLSEIIDLDPSVNLMELSKLENNDLIAIRKDGSTFSATLYSDIIKKGLRIIGRRGIIIDSTLRNLYIESLKNETKKAITSDKQKSSFLANMSHEIRTPMNSIIGFSSMLSSSEIPQEQKYEFINHIQTSSEMLLNLVDDIIDIAKIEAGQLKINKSECYPLHLVRDMVSSIQAYKSRLEKDHLEIRQNFPEEDIPFITDGFRVKQILTNLITNAIKFTECGWIEIGFRKKNQRTLEFYVEDTGIGMSNDELHGVFERFTRSKLSEEKKISGTGLGLAISKNLVEMLGGSMWVKSKTGKGSKFIFELPYLRVPKPSAVPAPIEVNDTFDFSGKNILVAEDDDNSFTFINHLLTSVNATAIRAVNGKEVVEAMEFKEKIDLILMDIQMPEMNGLEATAIIKKKYPRLPIIAQTAFALEGDREKFITAGFDDYIAKPIDTKKILAKIAQFIDDSFLQKTNTPELPSSEIESNITISSKISN